MSLLTSFTRPSPGGAQPDYILVHPIPGDLANAAWPTANKGIYLKFRLEKPTSMTGLSIGLSSASGNAKVGVFSSDKTTITQLALSASTALALPGGVAGYQDILFTAAVSGVPFQDYYAFVALDNASAQLYRTLLPAVGASMVGRSIYELVTQFTTPTTPQAISGLAGTLYGPAVFLITTG